MLEVVIALAIVVALLALVGQPLARRLADARFRETLSQVESAMMRVRADAQRTGSAIEVFARNTKGGVRLLSRQVDFGAGTDSEGETESEGSHEQQVLDLPAGYAIGEPEPSATPGSEGMAPPPVAAEQSVSAPASADVPGPLVIFLPDGSAARGTTPGVITDRSGRRAEMKVNTWTGRVELVAGPPPTAATGGARGRPSARRGRRHTRATNVPGSRVRAGRGALLLETMVALAIFVAGGLSVMAMVNRAAASMAMARDHRGAADLARSAMAKIEAGIAAPQTLNGPVAPWDPGEDTSDESGTEIGSGFSDAPPARSGWQLEIATEPSAFDGLTLVSVRAVRRVGDSIDRVRVSYTLRQLVRLGSAGSGTAGDQDPMAEHIKPAAESRGRDQSPSPEGGAR